VQPVLGADLQQAFGMAEGLVDLTRLNDPDEVKITTQGRPMCPHDEIRIVGDNGDPVPDGQMGVLLTRGPYTPRGYYRAPTTTRGPSPPTAGTAPATSSACTLPATW
jgi:salicylate---CoA ligase